MRLPRFISILVVWLACIFWSWTAPAGSSSSQEKGQTQSGEKSKKKTYTNEDLIRLRGTRRVNQGTPSKERSDKGKGKAEIQSTKRAVGNGELGSYRDANGHDRTYWQGRVRPLKNQLAGLELQIQSLQEKQRQGGPMSGVRVTRSGQLRTSAANSPQRLELRISELEKKKAAVQKSIQDLEDEARKAQALPEWLR